MPALLDRIKQVSTHIVSDEQLIAYAAGELSDAEWAKIAAHVVDCAGCSATVALFRAVNATLRSDDSVLPPVATLARAQVIFPPEVIAAPQPTGVQRAPAQRMGGFWHTLSGIAHPSPALAATSLLAVFVFLMLLSFASAVIAPALQSTLPGDRLYPVKMTFEGLELAATIDPPGKVQVEMAIARARVMEVKALVEQGRYREIPQTTRAFESRVAEVTTRLNRIVTQNPVAQVPLAQKVVTDLSQSAATLAALEQSSPAVVQAEIGHAAQVANAAQSNVQHQWANSGAPLTPASSNAPTITVPAIRATPTRTATASPSVTRTPTLTRTPLPAPSLTGTPVSVTPPPSNTNSPEATATVTPLPKVTPLPTSVVSETATATPMPTVTPMPTATPSVTAAPSATSLPKVTASPVVTTMPTFAPTLVPEPTATPNSLTTPSLTPPVSTPIADSGRTRQPTRTREPDLIQTPELPQILHIP